MNTGWSCVSTVPIQSENASNQSPGWLVTELSQNWQKHQLWFNFVKFCLVSPRSILFNDFNNWANLGERISPRLIVLWMNLGIFGKASVLSETALISINKVLSICQRSPKTSDCTGWSLRLFLKTFQCRAYCVLNWERHKFWSKSHNTSDLPLIQQGWSISRRNSGLSLKARVYCFGKVLVPKLCWVEVDRISSF